MRKLAICGIFLLPAAAWADIPVTALPFTASSPNRYFLTADLSVPAGSLGFVVDANLVTFDLNGHTITCAGGPTTITRAVSLGGNAGFTLTNGRIRNCAFGVSSHGTEGPATNARIENVQFVDNYYRGISVEVSDSEILNNKVVNTTAQVTSTSPADPTTRTGLPPPTSPTSPIFPTSPTRTIAAPLPGPTANAAVPPIAIGIEVLGERNIVRDNTVIDTKGSAESVGISFSDWAVGSVLAGNVIRNDPAIPNSYGIWIGGASDPKVVGNTVEGFTTGLAASSPTRGFYRNNTVMGAGVRYVIEGTWTDGGNNY